MEKTKAAKDSVQTAETQDATSDPQPNATPTPNRKPGHAKSMSESWHLAMDHVHKPAGLDGARRRLFRIGMSSFRRTQSKNATENGVNKSFDQKFKRSFTRTENAAVSAEPHLLTGRAPVGEFLDKLKGAEDDTRARIMAALAHTRRDSGQQRKADRVSGRSFELGRQRWKHYSESAVFNGGERL